MPKSSTLTTAYSYDSVGNLLTQASSGASDIAFSYSYNKNGYITGEVRTEGGKTTESTYAYDALASCNPRAMASSMPMTRPGT